MTENRRHQGDIIKKKVLGLIYLMHVVPPPSMTDCLMHSGLGNSINLNITERSRWNHDSGSFLDGEKTRKSIRTAALIDSVPRCFP